MKGLMLADLYGKSQDEVINHLVDNYSGSVSGFESDYGSTDEDKEISKSLLKDLHVVLAYEHVGDYGCDSSSFFIFKNQNDEYFELHGSHCSCYGFDGQLKYLEKTTLIVLKDRAEKDKLFYTGGYDNDSVANQKKANSFILGLV